MSESQKRFLFIAIITLGICNLIVFFLSWYYKTYDLLNSLIILIPMLGVFLYFYLRK